MSEARVVSDSLACVTVMCPTCGERQGSAACDSNHYRSGPPKPGAELPGHADVTDRLHRITERYLAARNRTVVGRPLWALVQAAQSQARLTCESEPSP